MSRLSFDELAAPIAKFLGVSVGEVGQMGAEDLRAASTRALAELDQAVGSCRDLGEVAS